MDPARARFVEDVALHWEAHGLPRIAGRIIGQLLICEPPHRSASQLREELGASKGSISTMLRLLAEAGSIEAVPVPGERATYYRLVPDAFEAKLERRLAAFLGFRDLAEQGAALLAAEGSARARELEELAALYGIIADALPELLERWRTEVAARRAEGGARG